MESFGGLRKRRGKANNNNLLKRKESYCPVAVATTPRALCTHTNVGKFWHSSPLSPLPCPARQQQSTSLSTAPRPTRALLCGQASLFSRHSLCVSMCRQLLFPGNASVFRTPGRLEWCLTRVFARALLHCLCMFVSYCLLIYLFVRRVLMISFRNGKYRNRQRPVNAL